MSSRFFNQNDSYQLFFNSLNDEFISGKIILDSSGQPIDFVFMEVNQSFLEKKRLQLEQVLHKNYLDIFQTTNSEWVKACGHTAMSRVPQVIELYIAEQGIHALARLFSPQAGEFMSLITDLSATKASPEQLELINQKLKLATDVAGMAVWEYDVTHDCMVSVNDIWRAMFGIDDLNGSGGKFREKVDPEYWHVLDNEEKFVRDPANAFTSYQYEFRYLHPNQMEWIYIRSKGYITRDGDQINIIGFSIDVTAEKNQLKQIQTENQFLEAITSNSVAAFFIYNIKTEKFHYINQEFTNVLGYTLKELNEMSRITARKTIILPQYLDQLNQVMSRVMAGEARVPIDYELYHKAGNTIYAYGIYSPFEKDGDEIITIIGSLLDISNLKEQEDEVRRATAQKEQFLSNMSHEIRTPLNGVLGFSKLLRTRELTHEKKEAYLNQIESNSRQLLTLIEDILDISKIDSGKLKLRYENCDMHHCMQDLEEHYNQRLKDENRDHELKVHLIPPKNFEEIRNQFTDVMRMKQVMTNLMDNALKFTPKGKIIISYEATPDKMISFQLKDTGHGIPAQDLTRIFQYFGQSEQHTANNAIKGTGLGLAISKGVIENMGGKIWAESEVGLGTIFNVLIPYKSAIYEEIPSTVEANDQNTHPEPKPLEPRQKKVLIADDNASVQFYYSSILEDYDVIALSATDGQTAVDLFKANPDTDLVLMDINMPKKDGVTAMKEIREINPHAVVVGQSAFAMAEHIQKYQNVGFTEYITKPVPEEAILRLLGLEQ